MFNPLYPFTQEVLDATIKRGCIYFVRNNYNSAFDHFNEGIKAYFLFTHYSDHAKALAHYNSITNDPNRFLYSWTDSDHQKKLSIAASNPPGYKIFSSYFMPNYKDKISLILKEKINKYMYRNTDWKPGKNEKVNLDFYLQFGQLFTTMTYAGQQLKVKFTDIEKQR